MAQRGRIFRKGSSWFLMYRTPIMENGERRMKQVVKKLAPCSDQYRSESSVRPLAEEILGPINAGMARPESTQTVAQFLEHYLTVCDTKLRPSTCKGYRDMFRLAKPHLGSATLREFHTPEADKLLRDATRDKQRAHTTHRNLKSFLSGAFKYAKRTGAISGENPVRDAEIPRGKPKGKRDAYSVDEISTMLNVLPEPSRTVVLTAALTGLRSSELRGLRWEDFDGDSVLIQRSVWQGKVSETKTLASKSYVPLVPFLLKALAAHRRRTPGKGWVFKGGTGNPLRIENNLVRDQMAEPMENAGVDWRGWHPFRYGVGTTLRALGVDIKLIQQILRHSDQRLTMDFYVKPTLDETRKAMNKLERALDKSLARKKA